MIRFECFGHILSIKSNGKRSWACWAKRIKSDIIFLSIFWLWSVYPFLISIFLRLLIYLCVPFVFQICRLSADWVYSCYQPSSQFVCCYSLWYDPSHQLRYSRPLISSSNYFDFYFYPVFVWIDSIHLPSCCRVLYKYTFCHNALCLFLPVEWKCVSILFLLHGVWRQGTPYLLLCIGCPIAFRLLSTIY